MRTVISPATGPAKVPAQQHAAGTATRVVDSLVHAGLVDAARRAEAQQVVTGSLAKQPATPRHGSSRAALIEIAGYLGGALVVAAFVLFLSQEWANFSDGQQTAWLVGIAVVLAVIGGFVGTVGGGYAEIRQQRDEIRRRLMSALLTAAAVVAAVTVARQIELTRDTFDSWPPLAGGLVMVALGALVYAIAPSVLTQLGIVIGEIVVVSAATDLVDAFSGDTVWPGLGLLAVGLVWLVLAESGVLRERLEGRIIGSGVALFGSQMPLFEGDSHWVGYLLTSLLAAAGIWLYLRTVSWPYLVLGVAAVTLVVPEMIVDWTEGSLGTAGAVLVAGLTLLAASLVGFRVRQEVGEDAGSDSGSASDSDAGVGGDA